MVLNGLEKISVILKLLASFYAIFPLLWGLMLAVGYGPDGPHESLAAYIMGFVLIIHAVSYLIPNSIIRRKNALAVVYLIVTIGFCSIPVINTSRLVFAGGRISSFELSIIGMWVGWFLLLLTAPFSLIFSIRGARKRSRESIPATTM